MRCRLYRYMWGINDVQAVLRYMLGIMRCMMCRYMWGINEKWALYVYAGCDGILGNI